MSVRQVGDVQDPRKTCGTRQGVVQALRPSFAHQVNASINCVAHECAASGSVYGTRGDVADLRKVGGTSQGAQQCKVFPLAARPGTGRRTVVAEWSSRSSLVAQPSRRASCVSGHGLFQGALACGMSVCPCRGPFTMLIATVEHCVRRCESFSSGGHTTRCARMDEVWDAVRSPCVCAQCVVPSKGVNARPRFGWRGIDARARPRGRRMMPQVCMRDTNRSARRHQSQCATPIVCATRSKVSPQCVLASKYRPIAAHQCDTGKCSDMGDPSLDAPTRRRDICLCVLH